MCGMRLISANVNGIRAAARRGGMAWLAAQRRRRAVPAGGAGRPTTSSREALAARRLRRRGTWRTPRPRRKGRAGVAVRDPGPARRGPGRRRAAASSTARAAGSRPTSRPRPGPVTVASRPTCTPARPAPPRQEEKLRFLDADRRAAATPGPRPGSMAVRHRRPQRRAPRGRPQELEGQPAQVGLPARGAGLLRPVVRRRRLGRRAPALPTARARAPTPGGPGAGRRSTTTRAGGSTTSWPAGRSRTGRCSAAVGRAAAYDQRWSDHAAVVVDRYDLPTLTLAGLWLTDRSATCRHRDLAARLEPSGQRSRPAPPEAVDHEALGRPEAPRRRRPPPRQRSTSPGRSAATSAMAEPPKPPPVIRAPSAPAATAASTAVSSSGTEISKSSRIEACEARNSAPTARKSSARKAAATVSRTRSISVTTCRARRRSRSEESGPERVARGRPAATSRRLGDAELAGGRLAGVAALGVLAVDQRVLGPGVDDEQGQPVRREVERHLLGVPVPAVQQQRVAGLREQGRGLVHAAGRRQGDGVLGLDAGGGQGGPALVGVASSPRPNRSDDARRPRRTRGPPSWRARRPAARGRPRPRRARPRHTRPLRSAHGTPATYAAHPPGRPGADVGEAAPPRGRRPAPRRSARRSSSRRRSGRERAVGQRDGQAEPAVVVGVLADQVDPAGRRPHPVGLGAERGAEQLGAAGRHVRSARRTGPSLEAPPRAAGPRSAPAARR